MPSRLPLKMPPSPISQHPTPIATFKSPAYRINSIINNSSHEIRPIATLPKWERLEPSRTINKRRMCRSRDKKLPNVGHNFILKKQTKRSKSTQLKNN
jgi:hypothetical protein